eukprot:5767098-Amphidinium_carterae.1
MQREWPPGAVHVSEAQETMTTLTSNTCRSIKNRGAHETRGRPKDAKVPYPWTHAFVARSSQSLAAPFPSCDGDMGARHLLGLHLHRIIPRPLACSLREPASPLPLSAHSLVDTKDTAPSGARPPVLVICILVRLGSSAQASTGRYQRLRPSAGAKPVLALFASTLGDAPWWR